MTTATAARAAGYSLLELLFVTGLGATLTAVSIPNVLAGLDDSRALAATRYVAMRLQLARMMAVNHTTNVGIRFEAVGQGFQFRVYTDGNGNGIRTADIQSGSDPPLAAAERLPTDFVGVDFGVLPGLPAVDSSSAAPGTDPIKFGTSNIASFTPTGSSSTGSAYVRGRSGAQYAVRVFGETGKVRILKFDPRTRAWKPL